MECHYAHLPYNLRAGISPATILKTKIHNFMTSGCCKILAVYLAGRPIASALKVLIGGLCLEK